MLLPTCCCFTRDGCERNSNGSDVDPERLKLGVLLSCCVGVDPQPRATEERQPSRIQGYIFNPIFNTFNDKQE